MKTLTFSGTFQVHDDCALGEALVRLGIAIRDTHKGQRDRDDLVLEATFTPAASAVAESKET